MKRPERTRQLIELGDLTAKADLVALTEDDLPVIFGILETAALMLRSGDRDQALVSWQRRAKRAFDLVVRSLSVDSFASRRIIAQRRFIDHDIGLRCLACQIEKGRIRSDEASLNAVELAAELTIAWLGNQNNRVPAEDGPAFARHARDRNRARERRSRET